MAKKSIQNKKQESDTEKSTILLDKEVIDLLKQAKDHPRQTYTELLRNMATAFISAKDRVREEDAKMAESRDKRLSNYIGDELLSSRKDK